MVTSDLCQIILNCLPTQLIIPGFVPLIFIFTGKRHMIQGAGALPPFTNISATRHKYRGGEIQIQIFCGLIAQIKLVNHGSTGEGPTPATRVIRNTAAQTREIQLLHRPVH